MSRIVFWNETDIIGECIYDLEECRWRVNGICFNNMSKKLGRKCHIKGIDECKDYVEEDNGNTKGSEKK